MGGICGYFLETSEPTDQDKISLMAKQLCPRRESSSIQSTFSRGAIAASQWPSSADIYTDDALSIVCYGNYHFPSGKKGTAEEIAQLYRASERNCLTEIKGSFCLAIVDVEADKLLLAIDRLGIERLCFQQTDDGVFFASDLNALFSHPLAKKTLDPQGIYNYLYYHNIPAPDTIYRNTEKLLPGQYAVFQNNRVEKGFYWHWQFEENTKKNLDSLVSEFHQCLDHSVSGSLDLASTLNGSMGAFLSGGTDSSTMVAAMTRTTGKPVKSFSIGFAADGYDETEYARITAQHFNAEHSAHYITPEDVLATLPLVSRHYDEPFGNASVIPTYCCAKYAQDHGITDMIAGDGGDEIFAGNKRYLKQLFFERYHRLPAILREGVVNPLVDHLPDGIGKIALINKAKRYIEQARIPLPDRLETYNFLHQEPADYMFETSFLEQINQHAPLEIMQDNFARTQSENVLNKMLHLDMEITLANNDLRKVGQATQMAGIRVHYPLLSDEMVKFAGQVPAGLKIKNGKLRYFFKHAMQKELASATLTKSKHGFGLPFGLWLREYQPLQALANDCLDAFKQRGYLSTQYIDQLRNAHANQHSDYYGVMIWTILTLELWLQHQNL